MLRRLRNRLVQLSGSLWRRFAAPEARPERYAERLFSIHRIPELRELGRADAEIHLCLAHQKVTPHAQPPPSISALCSLSKGHGAGELQLAMAQEALSMWRPPKSVPPAPKTRVGYIGRSPSFTAS